LDLGADATAHAAAEVADLVVRTNRVVGPDSATAARPVVGVTDAVSRAVDVLALVLAGLADELAVLEFAGLAVLADLPGDRAAVAGSILGVADVVPGAVHALAGILDADAVVAALVVRADLAAALAVSVG